MARTTESIYKGHQKILLVITLVQSQISCYQCERHSDYVSYTTTGPIVQKSLKLAKTYKCTRVPEIFFPSVKLQKTAKNTLVNGCQDQ